MELTGKVKNADQFWSKMKHGLNELKMMLPTGVIALIANADFGDTSALLITLSSESRSYKELEEQLKKLEAECRKIPTTSKIKHFGLQKEKIYVNVKPELLNEYNIKTLSLLGSYQLNGMVNYAGMLKDSDYELAVHLPPSFQSEKDLAEQIVYSDPSGNVVTLTLQQRVGRAWKSAPQLKVKPVRVGPRLSKYTIKTRLPRTGTWRLRASYADFDYAPAVSAYRTFRVK